MVELQGLNTLLFGAIQALCQQPGTCPQLGANDDGLMLLFGYAQKSPFICEGGCKGAMCTVTLYWLKVLPFHLQAMTPMPQRSCRSW